MAPWPHGQTGPPWPTKLLWDLSNIHLEPIETFFWYDTVQDWVQKLQTEYVLSFFNFDAENNWRSPNNLPKCLSYEGHKIFRKRLSLITCHSQSKSWKTVLFILLSKSKTLSRMIVLDKTKNIMLKIGYLWWLFFWFWQVKVRLKEPRFFCCQNQKKSLKWIFWTKLKITLTLKITLKICYFPTRSCFWILKLFLLKIQKFVWHI